MNREMKTSCLLLAAVLALSSTAAAGGTYDVDSLSSQDASVKST
ncbi:MAG: hypothetical protein ACYTG0_14335 [Planctomycetota bacterium]